MGGEEGGGEVGVLSETRIYGGGRGVELTKIPRWWKLGYFVELCNMFAS